MDGLTASSGIIAVLVCLHGIANALQSAPVALLVPYLLDIVGSMLVRGECARPSGHLMGPERTFVR
jgi:hypothetical protein